MRDEAWAVGVLGVVLAVGLLREWGRWRRSAIGAGVEALLGCEPCPTCRRCLWCDGCACR